jgi:site-specific recombinase XerD
MKGIQVEEPTPEVLSEAELRRLLKACEGKEFEDRRDMAVLRLMIDTGLRRFEIAQMTLDGTDLDGHVIRVVGKAAGKRWPSSESRRPGIWTATYACVSTTFMPVFRPSGWRRREP